MSGSLKGKRAGKRHSASHRRKNKAGRLVAGSLKARAVTREKQRGEAFLRKLHANGEAWWSDHETNADYLITRTRPPLYTWLLAHVGNRLRIGMEADKSGLLLVNGATGLHAYVPRKNVLGYVRAGRPLSA